MRGRMTMGCVGLTMMAVLCSRTGSAQTVSFNRDLIVLDPAHGGPDSGAKINDHVLEKDVTLAMASRLRSLLAARGFTVVSTRQDDPGPALTTDQRAEMANKTHAVACVVIHASATGNGVYVGTSAIGTSLAVVPSTGTGGSTGTAVPWDRAQEAYLSQSLRLANQAGSALARANVPLETGRVTMRPLDNLMCPAILIEVETLRAGGSDATPVSDEGYQQRVAEAIAGALVFWRNQAQPPETIGVPRAGAAMPEPKSLSAAGDRKNIGEGRASL